uniref:Uncharacterized protein n=1 Tax=viral metagenome TaxID=1070528 RepID=A0A6M3JVJ6_9ZZZZ
MEKKVSNILLGIAGSEDRFTLKFGWFSFRLRIKPITARQLIAISGEVAQIKDIDKEQEIFPALMGGITDIRYVARVITIATGTRYKGIVTRAILKLPLKDIQTLFAIVQKQSDPSPFFFTILLAKGRMNLLKKPE